MPEWRGWLISSTADPNTRGKPVNKIYAARIADPERAIAAVRKYANVKYEHLQILIGISVAHLTALEIPDGAVGEIVAKPLEPRGNR